MSSRMRFGTFIPPHHLPVNYNPTYALQRDVEIVQLADTIGFDEAWFGEHHSGGAEPIGDPMLFIAHVAAQTKYIRLGTGVVSLPYHNPLWVADRLAMLDHLTRGRVMLALIVAGLRGGGWQGEAGDLLSAEIEGGPMGAARVAAELLARAFMVPGDG